MGSLPFAAAYGRLYGIPALSSLLFMAANQFERRHRADALRPAGQTEAGRGTSDLQNELY